MARTDFRARIVAGTAAGLLVCAEGFRISFYLYLGARNATALPLRPAYGFRLEVFTAAGYCEPGSHGADCGVEIVAPASCQHYLRAGRPRDSRRGQGRYNYAAFCSVFNFRDGLCGGCGEPARATTSHQQRPVAGGGDGIVGRGISPARRRVRCCCAGNRLCRRNHGAVRVRDYAAKRRRRRTDARQPNCGVMGFLIKRNIITIFMSIELMLNGVNLSFVAFAAQWHALSGQVFVFFVMVVAAAEAAVGLAIIIAVYRTRETLNVDQVNLLKL